MSLVIAICVDGGELFTNSRSIPNAAKMPLPELVNEVTKAMNLSSYELDEILIIENDKVAKYLREELWELKLS